MKKNNPRIIFAAFYSSCVCAIALALAACGDSAPGSSDPAVQPALPFIKQLQTGNPAQRDAAVLELAKYPHDLTADALLKAAHTDNRIQVRTASIDALAQHKKLATAYVPRLTALLLDRDDEVRRAACETIGSLHLTSATDNLLARLSDKSPAVRTASLNALARLGPDAMNKLAAAFTTGSPEDRAAIAEAFADAGDTSRVPLLIDSLNADDEYLRRSVAASLGRLKDPRAIPPLTALIRSPLPPSKIAEFEKRLARGPTEPDLSRIADSFNRDQVNAGFRGRSEASQLKLHDPNVHARFRQLTNADKTRLEAMIRIVAMEAIREIDPDAGIDLIIQFLGDEDPSLADPARELLASLGDPYRKTLAQTARNTARPLTARLRAARLLTGKNDSLTRDTFTALVADSQEPLQLTAAVWLAEQKDPLAVPALIALLKSPTNDTRRSAATAMQSFPHPSLADPVTSAIAVESSPAVRRLLIKLAGTLQAKKALPQLLDIARKPSDPDRVEALHALASLADPSTASALLDIYKSFGDGADRGAVNATILALGTTKSKDAFPLLIKEVTSDPRDRSRLIAALTALGDLGDTRATPVIAAALKKPIRLNKVGVYEEGNAGISALAKLKDPASIDILTYLVRIEDSSGNTNKRAAEALAKMNLPKNEDLAALIQLLSDKDLSPAIKEAAVAPALVLAGERAVPPLLSLLLTAPPPDPKAPFDPGFYAAQILSYIGAPSVDPLLKAAAGSHPQHVQGRIIEALQLTSDPRIPSALAAFLNASQPAVRQWAAAALGKTQNPSALQILQSIDLAAEPDPEVKKSITWAIAQQQSMHKNNTP